MLIGLHEHWPVLKSKHNLVVRHKSFKDLKITKLREMFGMLGNTKGIIR